MASLSFSVTQNKLAEYAKIFPSIIFFCTQLMSFNFDTVLIQNLQFDDFISDAQQHGLIRFFGPYCR